MQLTAHARTHVTSSWLNRIQRLVGLVETCMYVVVELEPLSRALTLHWTRSGKLDCSPTRPSVLRLPPPPIPITSSSALPHVVPCININRSGHPPAPALLSRATARRLLSSPIRTPPAAAAAAQTRPSPFAAHGG